MTRKGVALWLHDDALISLWNERNTPFPDYFEFFTEQASILVALQNDVFDHIVIDAAEQHVTELSDFIEHVREQHAIHSITVIINTTRSNHRHIIRYCLAHDIGYIPYTFHDTDLVDKLFNMVMDHDRPEQVESNNIVVFVGTTPNIGTTVSAYTTALLLAQQTMQSIAYVCLNLKSSKIHTYIGADQPAVTLDSIRADIKSYALSADNIKQYSMTSERVPNLSIFIGNMAREQAEFYNVEDIRHLLDTISQAFDLCIVEVNAYWDNAATICSLMYADSKIMVSTDQLGHFQEDITRWLGSVAPAYRLDPSSFDLLITQYGGRGNGIALKHIRKQTGMNIVGKLRKLDHLEELLNLGRIDELTVREPQVKKDLSGLTTMLTAIYKLEQKHAPTRRWSGRRTRYKEGS